MGTDMFLEMAVVLKMLMHIQAECRYIQASPNYFFVT